MDDEKYLKEGRQVWKDLVMIALSKQEMEFSSFVTKKRKVALEMKDEVEKVLSASKEKNLFPLSTYVVTADDGEERMHNQFATLNPHLHEFVVKFMEFIHKSESFGNGIEKFNIINETIFPTIEEARAEIKRMQALAQV